MAKIHSTPDSFDDDVPLSNTNPDGTSDYSRQTSAPSDAAIQQNLENQKLPAQQESKGNINFLGSSYSGQDIKVVAHLYQTPANVDEPFDRLSKELAIAENIKDAALNLQGGGIDQFVGLESETFDTKRSILRGITGLSDADDAEQIAFNRIFALIFNGREGNLGTFLGLSKIRRALAGVVTTQESIIAELNARLKRLADASEVGHHTITLGTLQTLSLQSHREKFGVRALGHSYAKGYTRGQRTIAGSMIFTVFHEHALAQLTRALFAQDDLDPTLATILPDQLPPIDLTIAFANEYGQRSEARLYGVEFVNDGVVYSIEDLLSENTLNYVCRDADLLSDKGRIATDRARRFKKGDESGLGEDTTGTSLAYDNADYERYLQKLGVRRRFKHQ